MKAQAVVEQLISRLGHPELDQEITDLQPHFDVEVVGALKSRVNEEKWRNPQRALQIADLALAVAAVTNEAEARGLALWARGTALYYLSRYNEALDSFRQAEAIFRSREDWPAVARLQIGQIAMLTETGDYQTLLDLEPRARSTCHKLGAECARCLAGLEMNIGAAYEQMGRLQAALDAYGRGRIHFVTQQNATQVARIDINQAVVLEQMDRFADAERLLLGARSALDAAEHHLEVARADLNLGVLAYRRGRYQAALRRLELAHDGFAAIPNPGEVATVNLYRSFVYRDLNLVEDLISLAARAEDTFQRDGVRWQQTLAIINQGVGYWRLGAYAQAEVKLAQAHDLLQQQGASNRLLTLDLERAFLALETGELDMAESLAAQIQAQVVALDWPLLSARLHLLLARCALARPFATPATARALAETALLTGQAHDLADVIVDAHSLLGQIHEASGEPAAAWQAYQTAIRAIEELRAGLPLDEFQMGFMDARLPIYEAHVRLSQQLGSPAQVLQALNLAQTAPLLRLAPAISPASGPEHELRVQLRALRETWHWHQTKLEGQRDLAALSAEEEAARRGQLRELEAQIAELARRLQVRTVPLLSPDGPATPAAAEPDRQSAGRFLADLQARLAPQAGLLQLYVLDGHFQGLLVTRRSIRLVENLAPVQSMQRLLRSWRFQLEHARRSPDTARMQLSRFHQLLLAPLAADLAGIEQLYLVVPPAWHDLPVSAFYDGRRYLIERMAISYLSAPEVLLSPRPDKAVCTQALVIGHSDGQRLRHAPVEARQVTESLGPGRACTLLLEERATVDSLRAASRSSQLLHLATHAVFRPDNPFFSWMRLADDHLTVAELYEMTLPQRPLVVLSACETGRGQARGGGLLGMGRGFLAAGASGLVVSLWKVADEAAARLMVDFYGRLTVDGPAAAAAALRHAQCEALTRQPHPFFWAGFVFIQG